MKFVIKPITIHGLDCFEAKVLIEEVNGSERVLGSSIHASERGARSWLSAWMRRQSGAVLPAALSA